MDLVAVLVAIIAIVISVLILLYCLTGQKEKSFEEIVAEQRGINILINAAAPSKRNAKKEQQRAKKPKPKEKKQQVVAVEEVAAQVDSDLHVEVEKGSTAGESSSFDHSPNLGGGKRKNKGRGKRRKSDESREEAFQSIETITTSTTVVTEEIVKEVVADVNTSLPERMAPVAAIPDVVTEKEEAAPVTAAVTQDTIPVAKPPASKRAKKNKRNRSPKLDTAAITSDLQETKVTAVDATDVPTPQQPKEPEIIAVESVTVTSSLPPPASAKYTKTKDAQQADLLFQQLETVNLTEFHLKQFISIVHARQPDLLTIVNTAQNDAQNEIALLRKQLAESARTSSKDKQMLQGANHTVAECKDTLERQKNQVAQLEADNQRLMQQNQAELQRLSLQLSAKVNELTDLQQKYFQMQKAFDQTGPQKISQLMDESRNLKFRLANADKDMGQYSSENQRLKIELTAAQKMMMTMKHSHDQSQKQIRISQIDSSHPDPNLQKQLDHHKMQIGDLQQQLNHAQNEIAREKSVAAQLSNDSESRHAAELTLLNTELTVLKAKALERKPVVVEEVVKVEKVNGVQSMPPAVNGDMNGHIREDVDKLQKQVDDLKTLNDRLLKQLSDATGFKSDAEERIRALLDAVANKEVEMGSLKEQCKLLLADKSTLEENDKTQRLDQMEKLQEEVNAKLGSLAKEHDQLKVSLVTVTKERDGYLDRITTMEQNSAKERETMLNSQNNMSSDLAEIKAQLQVERMNVQKIETEKSELSKHLASGDDVTIRLNVVSDEKSKLEQEVAALKQQLTETERYTTEIQQQKEKISTLSSTVEQLQSDVVAANEAKETATRESDDIQKRLTASNNEHEIQKLLQDELNSMKAYGVAPVSIVYDGPLRPRHECLLAGTMFVSWDIKKPLHRDGEGRYKLGLLLPPGKYEFKFIVDGQWLSTDRYEKNTAANDNNLIVVADAVSQIAQLETERLSLQENVRILEISLAGTHHSKTKMESDLKSYQKRNTALDNALADALDEVDRLHLKYEKASWQIQELRKEQDNLVEYALQRSPRAGPRNYNYYFIEQDGSSTNVTETKILKEKEQAVFDLSEQLALREKDLLRLNGELAQVKRKNTDLREKNYKALEAASQVEKAVQEVSKRATKEVEAKYKGELEQQRSLTKELLQKAFPDTKIPPAETYKEWLHEFEKVVKYEVIYKRTHSDTKSVENGTVRNCCDKLTKENANLQSQLTNYKLTLAQTENMLHKLEQSVEKEQESWKDRCFALEAQLSKMTSVPVTPIVDTSQADEVKSQLTLLEERLRIEEIEKSKLVKEITRIETELTVERKTGKDLSAQAVKLRGMVKVGQDSLAAEQMTVEQLKGQLKLFEADGSSGAMSPGRNLQTATDNGVGGLVTDLNGVKDKLDDRTKQLERQISINKQLLNKLSTLGVTGATYDDMSFMGN